MRRGFVPIVIIVIGIVILGIGALVLNKQFSKTYDAPSENRQFSELEVFSPTPILETPTASPSQSPTSTSNSKTNSSPKAQASFSSPEPLSLTPQVDSISPSSISYSKEIIIKGKGFGSNAVSAGGVNFYKTTDNKEAGATIKSWKDTEIVAAIPEMEARKYYKVQVTRQGGSKSNTVEVYMEHGKPEWTSLYPEDGYVKRFAGKEYGSSAGELIFFKNNVTLGKCAIISWSDTEIKCEVPSNLGGYNEQGLRIITSDGRTSSDYSY